MHYLFKRRRKDEKNCRADTCACYGACSYRYTKVDRSASYAARYVAKNIVKAGLAKKCEVQIAYAIGIASPVSVMIDTFGTAVCDEEKISEAVNKLVDLRPAAIINKFELRKPIYKQLAAYGHMGREELGVKWEECDIADELKALCLG